MPPTLSRRWSWKFGSHITYSHFNVITQDLFLIVAVSCIEVVLRQPIQQTQLHFYVVKMRPLEVHISEPPLVYFSR